MCHGRDGDERVNLAQEKSGLKKNMMAKGEKNPGKRRCVEVGRGVLRCRTRKRGEGGEGA